MKTAKINPEKMRKVLDKRAKIWYNTPRIHGMGV